LKSVIACEQLLLWPHDVENVNSVEEFVTEVLDLDKDAADFQNVIITSLTGAYLCVKYGEDCC